MNDVLAGYAAASAELAARFEAISTRDLLAPVLDLLPSNSVRVADVGAGTGRDAAWFAAQGHDVLAVELVAELRAFGMAHHPGSCIRWLDDRLPILAAAREHAPFDLVTSCAVWQHLDNEVRPAAMSSLSAMTQTGGLLILSLREGVGAPDRRVFPVSVPATLAAADACGFDLVRAVEAPSVQGGNRANGVRWTWLALRKRLRRDRHR